MQFLLPISARWEHIPKVQFSEFDYQTGYENYLINFDEAFLTERKIAFVLVIKNIYRPQEWTNQKYIKYIKQIKQLLLKRFSSLIKIWNIDCFVFDEDMARRHNLVI